MFVKQSGSNGRTYLSIVRGYRDTDGKAKTKVVQKLGYLDELEKEYADPLAYFRAVAKQMTDEQDEGGQIVVKIDKDKQLERGGANRKNYGHVVYSKIYHELEIDRFLKNARRHENFKFNTDAIMRLLVFTRLLHPGSKRAAVLNKDRFFDNFKFSLDDTYAALTHFDKISSALQQHLHEQVTRQYGRKTDLVYYDVTNYYFEIDKQDDLRRKGAGKEHRPKPIVQMGLFMDTMALPILYKMFPGNKHDSQTLLPMLTQIKKTFGVKRIITVADKGLNSGDNIAYSTALGDGYIYSKSVRGASKDFKEWLLEESGYRKLAEKDDLSGDEKDAYESDNEDAGADESENAPVFKVKSKVVPDAVIDVTVEQIGKKKKKKKVKIEQKWVATYSEKYAARTKRQREDAVFKALQLMSNPSKYRNAVDYGAAGYIKNLKIDKETGEILNIDEVLVLDREKIEQEIQLDGYYALVTSELDDEDEHIIDMYRGLWRIEESFKITKSVLGKRPLFVSTEEHINAHFLICFTALLIARAVELRLDGKYNVGRIAESLRKASCSHLGQNLWLFDFADEVTDAMNEVFGTDFGRQIMTLQEIKKNLGMAKTR